MKALLEGTVFTHKGHVEDLRSNFGVTRVRLAGGGSRSEPWSQIFADALDTTVEVTEAGALGAAVCAGIGTGLYSSLDATGRVVRLLRTHDPEPEGHDRLAEAYETYTALAQALEPVWSRLG